jgi:2-desacetyl-2-hydroxyethyl bacteriochlorophyllide A dehydrogenase
VKVNGRQVVVRGPRDLHLEDQDLDLANVGKDEVVVRNRYSAISAGTELSIYTGINPKVYEPNSWCNYPFHPGYAGLGEVAAVGTAVNGLDEGDLVFHHAHHASFDVADSGQFPHVKISKEMMLPEVAVVRFAAIVLSGAIRLTKKDLGDRVVLFGLGLVGQMAAQLYHLSGCEVMAFDPVESRRSVAESIGACAAVYDPGKTNPVEEVGRWTGGRGADVMVEATGLPSVVADNVGAVRREGQVVLLGLPHGRPNSDFTELFRRVFLNWITVVGALERDFPLEPSPLVRHSYLEDVDYLLGLIRKGKLKTKELVSVVAPSEFKGAYEGLLGPFERQASQGEERIGVVVDWSRE